MPPPAPSSPYQGQVEAELADMGFERVSIIRPGGLLCDREERRLGEKCILGLLTPVVKLFPTSLTTPTSTCGKALVNLAAQGATAPSEEDKVKILDIKAIFRVAGEL